LIVRLRGAGYTVVASSLDNLVDTTVPEYEGTPEARFPPSDRMHGYNAIGGLSVTAEKTDGRMAFTVEEIETVRDLAVAFGRVVYGRSLMKTP